MYTFLTTSLLLISASLTPVTSMEEFDPDQQEGDNPSVFKVIDSKETKKIRETAQQNLIGVAVSLCRNDSSFHQRLCRALTPFKPDQFKADIEEARKAIKMGIHGCERYLKWAEEAQAIATQAYSNTINSVEREKLQMAIKQKQWALKQGLSLYIYKGVPLFCGDVGRLTSYTATANHFEFYGIPQESDHTFDPEKPFNSVLSEGFFDGSVVGYDTSRKPFYEEEDAPIMMTVYLSTGAKLEGPIGKNNIICTNLKDTETQIVFNLNKQSTSGMETEEEVRSALDAFFNIGTTDQKPQFETQSAVLPLNVRFGAGMESGLWQISYQKHETTTSFKLKNGTDVYHTILEKYVTEGRFKNGTLFSLRGEYLDKMGDCGQMTFYLAPSQMLKMRFSIEGVGEKKIQFPYLLNKRMLMGKYTIDTLSNAQAFLGNIESVREYAKHHLDDLKASEKSLDVLSDFASVHK